MAKLEWDKTGTKKYEAGVDHGVLYPNNGGPGVPWNGLISIEEQVSGGETEAYYFDGIKYFDSVAVEDFQATIRAFTYPDEFAACEGSVSIVPGFVAEYQTRQTFGLSWRTKAGTDVNGIEHGDQIHIVYNATAAPSSKSYQTLDDSPTPVEFEWTINAVPLLPGQGIGGSGGDPNVDFLDWQWPTGPGMPGWPVGPDGNTPVDGWTPTPYVVIDLGYPGNPDIPGLPSDIFDDLNDRLNGTPETLPYLPNLMDLVDLLNGNVIPNAPLDPDFVPGGWGGPNAIGPMITEVYQGALDDYPDDTIIPYGPPNLSDADDSTNIIVSPLHAADWFLYYDTSKMNFDASGFTFKFRVNSGVIQPQGIQLQLFDAASTFDAAQKFNINLPPGGNDVWGVEDWYLDLADGFSEYEFAITPEWVEATWDGFMQDPQLVVTPWLASHQGAEEVTHFTYANLVAAIKSRPWFVAHFRYDAPGAMNYDSAIEVVEAVVDLAPIRRVSSLGVTLIGGTPALGGDHLLPPPPWSGSTPFWKTWQEIDSPDGFKNESGFWLKFAASEGEGQKVKLVCSFDSADHTENFTFEKVITVPAAHVNTYMLLDETTLTNRVGSPWSVQSMIERMTFNHSETMFTTTTATATPVETNTKAVMVAALNVESWKFA